MYLLFTGFNYYPSGGWNDFHDSYCSSTEATKAAASIDCDWWHVVLDDHIVESGQRPDPY